MAEFENAVTKMNKDGKSSTEILTKSGVVLINKEKGEWKKPDTQITAGGDNNNNIA